MLKKILIASAMFAAMSGLAFANGGSYGGSYLPPVSHHIGMFYAGASVNRDTAHFDTSLNNVYVRTNFSPPQINYVLNVSKKFDWSMDGIGGEVFAGYGLLFQDRYYLALEGFGDISSNKGKFNKSIASTGTVLPGSPSLQASGKVDQKWSTGVSLIPGVMLGAHTMLYARVGWIYSEFDVNGNIDGIDSRIYQPLYKFDNSTGKNGLQLGLGMQAMITPNIGLRGEWDWSRYENIDLTVSGNAKVPVNETLTSQTGTAKIHIDPVVDQFKVAILYNFNIA